MKDRPLRIAIFSDSALPILNGVSVSVDVLIRELRRRGHHVYLFTTHFPGHRDRDPNVVRFPSVRLPRHPTYPLSVPPFALWNIAFRRISFDVVHTHTPFTVGLVGKRWAKMSEIPIVSTYHTHYDRYTHYIPALPDAFVRERLSAHTKSYYNKVSQVITPSHSSRQWLRGHDVRTPITVIPTGIPEPRPMPKAEARQELDLDPDVPVLLYVGRIAREKDVSTLLRMHKRVLKTHPDALLLLVGDGPYRNEIQVEARDLGIGDHVRIEGFVPRAQVDRYYAASDMFVFASQTETQGLVVVEAMSYGLPTVVVAGGGAGEAVAEGKNGFLVPPNPDAMAVRVEDLLHNPELRATMSEAAIETADDYTIERMVDRVLGVYGAAMGVKPSSERVVG